MNRQHRLGRHRRREQLPVQHRHCRRLPLVRVDDVWLQPGLGHELERRPTEHQIRLGLVVRPAVDGRSPEKVRVERLEQHHRHALDGAPPSLEGQLRAARVRRTLERPVHAKPLHLIRIDAFVEREDDVDSVSPREARRAQARDHVAQAAHFGQGRHLCRHMDHVEWPRRLLLAHIVHILQIIRQDERFALLPRRTLPKLCPFLRPRHPVLQRLNQRLRAIKIKLLRLRLQYRALCRRRGRHRVVIARLGQRPRRPGRRRVGRRQARPRRHLRVEQGELGLQLCLVLLELHDELDELGLGQPQ